jgi:protein-tyrosine phosphatase
MKAILTEIDRGLKEGRTLYVHCWGGVGRTGTVVGCYLRQHGMNGEQSLEQLARWWSSVPKRSVHPQSPETAEQRRFIVEWDTPA